jgi:hypothetical protein
LSRVSLLIPSKKHPYKRWYFSVLRAIIDHHRALSSADKHYIMKAKANKVNRLRKPSERTWTLIELINSACAGKQSEMQDRLLAFLGDDFNDADRIRICARCGQIFWAGRIDMAVCATCAPAWRVAQHRARKGRSNNEGAK